MKHYTTYRHADRLAIVDNASNVIALLSAAESERFQAMQDMLGILGRQGLTEFFDDKMEELCGAFLGVAA